MSEESVLKGRAWRALCVVVCVAMACGCQRDVGTIRVEVCGDVLVPDEVDAVRVSVLGAQRDELRAGVRELVVCPADRLLELPQVVRFDGVDEADGWVVVQGLKEGVERMRFERRVSLSTEVAEVVRLGLVRSCLGVQCPLGQTCWGGECAIVSDEEPSGVCAMGVVLEPEEPEPLDMEHGEEMESSEPPPQVPRYCPAPPMVVVEEEEES